MLRACRRLLRPGGRVAFFTILVAPDLARAEHRRAAAAGPPESAAADIAELLRRARFVDIVAEDRTTDYAATARAWLAARLRHRDEMRPLDPTAYDERIERGRQAIPIIQAGHLCRWLFVARRPIQK